MPENDITPNDMDLGLDDSTEEKAKPVKEATKVAPVKEVKKPEAGVTKVNEAVQKAAATAAVEAAVSSSSLISQRDAEKVYIQEKKRHMLNKCKNDAPVKFVGQKIFASYFGSPYTFLYNTIPVTIRFDGTEQIFPKFIYDVIQRKITEVSDSNTPKDSTITL